ncbi:unnamed protein product, partial [Ectocarpus sp. 12 AP-2014]
GVLCYVLLLYICVCWFPNPSSPAGYLWGPPTLPPFAIFPYADTAVAVALVGDGDDDIDVAVIFIFNIVLTWYQRYQHPLRFALLLRCSSTLVCGKGKDVVLPFTVSPEAARRITH